MKYSELERRLKKHGCFVAGDMNGHPFMVQSDYQ